MGIVFFDRVRFWVAGYFYFIFILLLFVFYYDLCLYTGCWKMTDRQCLANETTSWDEILRWDWERGGYHITWHLYLHRDISIKTKNQPVNIIQRSTKHTDDISRRKIEDSWYESCFKIPNGMDVIFERRRDDQKSKLCCLHVGMYRWLNYQSRNATQRSLLFFPHVR